MHYRRIELIQFIRETGPKNHTRTLFIRKTGQKTEQATETRRPHDARPPSQQRHTPDSGAAAPTSPTRTRATTPHDSTGRSPSYPTQPPADHNSCATIRGRCPDLPTRSTPKVASAGPTTLQPSKHQAATPVIQATTKPHWAITASHPEAAASAYLRRPGPPPRLPLPSPVKQTCASVTTPTKSHGLRGGAFKKVATMPPPTPGVWVFTRRSMTLAVGDERSSTTMPTRRKMTQECATIVGTRPKSAQAFARSTAIPTEPPKGPKPHEQGQPHGRDSTADHHPPTRPAPAAADRKSVV